MWQIAILAVTLASSAVLAEEDQYDTTNCRGQSTFHLVDGQPAKFSTQMRDANRQAEDIKELEICESSLGSLIVRQFSDNSGFITEDDHGFIEYHPPGQKEFTRCQYEIQKGTPVSQDLLRFNGTIPGGTAESWPWKRVFDLVKPIVMFGCQLIS